MKVSELFEGWFSKKKPKEEPRADFTEEDREMIKSVFKTDHNANVMYSKGVYVLPGNVNVVFRRNEINLYKRGNTIHASVAIYLNDGEAGNPRKSPYGSFNVVIKSKQDLVDLKAELSGEKKSVKEGWFGKKKEAKPKFKVGQWAEYKTGDSARHYEGEIKEVTADGYKIGNKTVAEKDITNTWPRPPNNDMMSKNPITAGSIAYKEFKRDTGFKS